MFVFCVTSVQTMTQDTTDTASLSLLHTVLSASVSPDHWGKCNWQFYHHYDFKLSANLRDALWRRGAYDDERTGVVTLVNEH